MEPILRVTALYLFVMVGLRMLGKREFSQLSPFELVTLLLIPEIASQALVGQDFSVTGAMIGLSTLFVLVFLTSLAAHANQRVERVITGEPTVLVSHGAFVPLNMDRERITADEIYGEMRKVGLHRLDQIRWAILESDGRISFVPMSPWTTTPGANRGESAL